MRIALVGVALALTLTACAPGATVASDPPVAEETQSPTPTPTPTEVAPLPTPLDPTDFVTEVGGVDGVDFDSVDRNVHCGIMSNFSYYGFTATATIGAYVGCRPLEADYQTEPHSDPSGNVGCRGGQVFEDHDAEPVCNGGQAFAGEDPSTYTVGVLPVGSSLSVDGFTCVSPDEQSVECSSDETGHGFTVGRSSYRYF